ncbi:MAG: enoyl-CoA hydratase-related protein [Clostridia bacterium]|nr:enoyl-CoA hydratase-related protein [Clostridia bacterium]
MNYNFLTIERKEKIAVVTINREEVLNAITREVLEELEDAFRAIEKDQTVRCAILTGKGRAFVAGADIGLLNTFEGQAGRSLARFGQSVMRYIEEMDTPVIAAINGFAIGGGCELAMCCDIRVASKKAKFGQPEVNLGITPGYGGSQRLTRLVGKGMAKYLCMTGNMIDASTAEKIGLVEVVTEPEKLTEEALKIAETIALKAPIAVSLVKQAINAAEDAPLNLGIAYEAEIYNTAFKTQDRKEGLNAFLEKRQPEFYGK